MKERPIIFSAPMVRAILAGTKTQTRRVVKPDGKYRLDLVAPADGGPSRCPYGKPGDRLWVRETWYFEGTDMMRHGRTHSTQDGVVRYLADGKRRTINTDWRNVEAWMTRKPQNRPGIHMPRWASRITLQITAGRVERLQDINEADAIAEGVSKGETTDGEGSYALGFLDAWEAIYGPGSWDANPWVWVIEFRGV